MRAPELPDATRTATREAAATEAPGSPELQGRSPARLGRGSSVDRYVILDRIGEGGMGEVYRAFDPDLNRSVAIKLLRARERRAGAAEQRRLLREARAIARLSHPNVVHVYDVGDAGDEVFIAMELVEGTTLREWMKERRPVDEVLDVFEQAAAGLAAAHRAGIVHRDFKPANVLLGKDGRVRVVDFGLARGIVAVDDNDTRESLPGAAAAPASAADSVPRTPIDGTLTVAGAAVGTPGYMAPEQERGGPIDARADVYSFCVALYEALEGERPARAGAPGEIASAPRPQRRPRRRQTPPWLQRLVTRGLEADPGKRPASMIDLEAALRRGRRRRRRQLLGASAAACILAVTAYWAGSRLNVAQANASVCEAGPARMDQVWNPARAAELEKAFVQAAPHGLGASTWRTVAARLETSTGAWQQMRRDACEATRVRGEQSEQLMDLRVACLDRRLLELDAVLALLADPDEKLIAESPRILSELPALGDCADTMALLSAAPEPTDPVVREQVDALERPLADARALLSAGRHQEGKAVTEVLLKQASAIGYSPSLARASHLHAEALNKTGDHQAALEHLQIGLIAAERAGDDQLRAVILLDAAYIYSEYLFNISRTEDFVARAEAVVARLGSPPRLHALLLNVKRGLLVRRGDHDAALEVAVEALDTARNANHPTTLQNALVYYGELLNLTNRAHEAIPLLEEATAEAVGLWGEDNPKVASLLHTLANAYSKIGDYERTAAIIRRGLEIRVRTFGPDHAEVSDSYHNLSNALRNLGQKEEALDAAKKSLELRTSAFGPSHTMVGFSHRIVGIAHHALGEHEAALDHLQRAERISRAVSETHPFLRRDLWWLGQVSLGMGRLDDAERYTRAAMAIHAARGEDDDKALGYSHTALAAVEIGRDRPRTAQRHLARAEAIAASLANAVDLHAECKFLRAQVLWSLEQHEAAIAAAEHAIELYRTTPSGEPQEVERIQSWLSARHPPAPARVR